jgi:hypothetical protein
VRVSVVTLGVVKIPTLPDASRHELLLDREVNRRFSALARERGHRRSALWFRWFANAVVDARMGRPVPAVAPESHVPGRRWAKMAWVQDDQEVQAWRAELEAVDSSPTAVLRVQVRGYLEADGDVIVMDCGK